jgi:hypothetical protein
MIVAGFIAVESNTLEIDIANDTVSHRCAQANRQTVAQTQAFIPVEVEGVVVYCHCWFHG